MAIDKDTVRYISNLARIRLKENELQNFVNQLSTILEYINKLNKLETNEVQPTSHVLELKNVFRQDIAKGSLSQEASLANAPQTREGFFVVPKIIK